MTQVNLSGQTRARDAPMELFKEMAKSFFTFHKTMEAAVEAKCRDRHIEYIKNDIDHWPEALKKWRSQKLNTLAEFAKGNSLCEKDIAEFFTRHGMEWC